MSDAKSYAIAVPRDAGSYYILTAAEEETRDALIEAGYNVAAGEAATLAGAGVAGVSALPATAVGYGVTTGVSQGLDAAGANSDTRRSVSGISGGAAAGGTAATATALLSAALAEGGIAAAGGTAAVLVASGPAIAAAMAAGAVGGLAFYGGSKVKELYTSTGCPVGKPTKHGLLCYEECAHRNDGTPWWNYSLLECAACNNHWSRTSVNTCHRHGRKHADKLPPYRSKRKTAKPLSAKELQDQFSAQIRPVDVYQR